MEAPLVDTVSLNGAGRSHMDDLIGRGLVDKGSDWSLSSDERGHLDGSMFLGIDSAAAANTEAHFKYPFGKDGKVYRSALIAIESRATAQGENSIAEAARAALARVDGKMHASAIEMQDRLKNREIFAVGKWNASTGPVVADTAMLNDMVKSYNELNAKVPGYAIPIKLGHNKRVGEPAMGYATNVRRDGGTLLADFTDVPPEIVDAIAAKRYNAVSVELWPKVEHAGRTFANVLSGVALLGAEWPAVKGLQPVYASQFSGDGALTLFQEEDTMNFTQEQHEAILAAAVTKATADAKAEFTAELAALTGKVTSAEQARDTAQAALDAFADEAEKAAVSAVIEAAEKAGKIVPANKAKIAAFAETIRTSVAKGEARKALVAQFSEFVEALPVRVGFKESGAASDERPGDEDIQTTINAKVLEVRKADRNLTYKDALDIVFSENPELKTRYAEER